MWYRNDMSSLAIKKNKHLSSEIYCFMSSWIIFGSHNPNDIESKRPLCGSPINIGIILKLQYCIRCNGYPENCDAGGPELFLGRNNINKRKAFASGEGSIFLSQWTLNILDTIVNSGENDQKKNIYPIIEWWFM